MIVFFLNLSRDWLDAHDLYRFVRIFDWVSFRAIAAVILSFLIVTFFGRRVIQWLIRQKVGDAPEFYNADLNRLMMQKANTPTMGGLLISGAIIGVALLLGDLSNQYVRLGLVVVLWLSVLGGVDDWLKLTSARRSKGSREGLYAWEKLLFQLGVGVLVGLFVYRHGAENPQMAHSFPSLPLVRAYEPGTTNPENLIYLSGAVFTLIATLMIAGGSNAVNLTDGMDGLAAGIAAICSFAFMVLCGIAGDTQLATQLLIPHIPFSGELSIIAGSMAGACLGFLWYNCAPAQVFMGDTGSLALGGLLAYIAVVIRQEFLLILIGGVFMLEMMSVVLQVGYFKMTGGRRIFRCAPIHHHFHLGGWTEQQVVVRFWLITAILSALALATIKLR
ncbi:MAG: phospho-N-acetylmuramoyl-pentapeptide-transferase [Phycisphaerales bacterium]